MILAIGKRPLVRLHCLYHQRPLTNSSSSASSPSAKSGRGDGQNVVKRESLKSRLKALENQNSPIFDFKRRPPTSKEEVANRQAVNRERGGNTVDRKTVSFPVHKGKGVEVAEEKKQDDGIESLFAFDEDDGEETVRDVRGDKGSSSRKTGMTSKMMAKEREREKKERLALKEERLMVSKQAKKEKTKKVSQKTIQLQEGVTVNNLAILLGVSLRQLQRAMVKAGFDEYPADYVLNSEIASLLVMEYNMVPIVTKQDSTDLGARIEPEDWSEYPLRPPVITIMGHVDHGKTTLLDALRKTSVAAGEAGGITQHIGAFSVKLPPPSNKLITFLDTPGHAAFSHMRQRGAKITDIVVLVVAADDGVMPQTIEAINHSLKAQVPIIVAINKCDKPGVNPQKIKQDLLRYDIVVEEMGGEIPAVHISGKTGMGLQELEETILALAEVADYRGDPSGHAEGIVVEAKHTKQFGSVATIIVKRGTLKPGAILVAGNAWCKVKRMIDEYGRTVKQVEPSGPVEVLGWKELPEAGDLVLQSDTEMLAKKVVTNRKRKQEMEASLKAIDDINQKRSISKAEIAEGKEKAREEKQRYRHNLAEKRQEAASNEFRVIVKGDVHGSVEAIEGVINELPNHEVYCNIISSGVGAVTESDVEFARVTNATIFAFNVPAHRSIQNLAEESKVKISSHSVIYTLVDAIKEELSELLEPVLVVNVVGEALVQALFPVTVKKKVVETVAGCKILSGKVTRQAELRVLRNGQIVLEKGKIKTFKHHKKDILEAGKGMECGINIEDHEDVLVGDIIQSLSRVETKRFLAAFFLIHAILGLNYKVSIDTELVKSRGSASTFHPNSLDLPLVVDGKSDPSLKIQIKLQDKDTLDLLSANQVFFTLENQLNADDRTSFLVSKKGAVYSVELNAKNFAAGTFLATLYVADEKLEALQYSFGSIEIYNGKDVSVDLYRPLKEIVHKFRPEVKDPADFIPNFFSAMTLAPWAILWVMWSSQGVNLRNYTANASLLIISTFYLISLAVSLLLFHTFWLKLNLFQLFGFGVPLWGITAVIGRYALIQRADLRNPKDNDE